MRPDWDQYFLGLAFIVSQRSRDPNTQHGCVLVDSENRIVGTGYNSFIRNIDDSKLPTSRPEKYDYMIHDTANALLNCVTQPYTAYTTGKCCLHCLQLLYQRGIKRIVMADCTGWQKDDEQREKWEHIVKLTDLKVEFITPNTDWIVQYLKKISKN